MNASLQVIQLSPPYVILGKNRLITYFTIMVSSRFESDFERVYTEKKKTKINNLYAKLFFA